MSRARRHIDVTVIVPPRALLLDIAGPIEVLRRANIEQQDVLFDVRYASPARAVASSIGLTLSGIDALPDPAIGNHTAQQWREVNEARVQAE